MPKVRIPYRVKRPFSIFRKGQIIYPEGMRRSELLSMCFIEVASDLLEPAPVPVPEPVPVVEVAKVPEPEVATAPEPEPPKRRRGRPRKQQQDEEE